MAQILVVEDEESLLQTLRYNLSRAGHEVRLSTNGMQALDMIRGNPPELVVLDLMLPGLDGLEVAKRLRARHDGGGMLLVATTGWGKPEDRRQSAEAGFDLHLTKPVDLALAARLLASRSDAKG